LVDTALRTGVRKKYLPDETNLHAIHTKLARYFGETSIGVGPIAALEPCVQVSEERVLSELPYHLSKVPGEGHKRLVVWLADMDNFVRMWEHKGHALTSERLRRNEDLMGYWKLLSDARGEDVIAVYKASLSEYQGINTVL